jgi:hypothetical protein
VEFALTVGLSLLEVFLGLLRPFLAKRSMIRNVSQFISLIDFDAGESNILW